MNNFKTGSIIFVLVAAAGMVYFSLNNESVSRNEDAAPAATVILGPRTDDKGSVTVTVVPEDVSETGLVWNFSIVMDTHSVELAADLMESAVLADDQGSEFQPLAWEGDGPGGHHRSGILKFKPITPLPKSITLKIFDLGGVPERSFLWIF